VAKIQLGQEILVVEALIDEHDHDAAFRQLVLARDKYGRRPEFRYLQALFDASFGIRPDKELLREVTALVAEQPDFSEAIALLAWLYDRTGDRGRAEVFAREALHAVNPRALARARRVIDGPSAEPAAPEPTAAPAPSVEPDGAALPPPAPGEERRPAAVFVPTPSPAQMGRSETVAFERTAEVAGDSGHELSPRPPSAAPNRDDNRTPTPAPPPSHLSRPPAALPPLVGTNPGFAPPTPAMIASAGTRPTPAPGAVARTDELPAVETIDFSPAGNLPPPPSIPAAALSPPRTADHEPFSGLRAERARTGDVPRSRVPTPPPIRPTPAPPIASERPGPLSTDYRHRPSRTAIAIPPPVEVQRHWFKYARTHQVESSGAADSTALMLLDLAERVVEGRTPLSSGPVPLDRSGLILIEERLEPYRNGRGTVTPAERAATTSAAAFLLAVLMKESDARAVDAPAEDGACKAVLPSGASVRPLLIAASFVRGRGPGLVESFDRAATAHMQRPPRSVTRQTTSDRQQYVDLDAQTVPIIQGRRTTQRSPLSVQRRDLDAGPICVIDTGTPMSLPVPINIRSVAEDFWSSSEGAEFSGGSHRVGTFSLTDIDAIERYMTRALPLIGVWPPGLPWPWIPTEEHEKQIYLLGAVLGEVLVSVYSGQWEVDPSEPHDRHLYRVVLAGSVLAWPMSKIYLRIARGVSHDLSAYVVVLGRVVGRQATRGL